METSTSNLIDAVDRERVKRALSDRQFSHQILGISPSYWCLLKSGKRPLTLGLLRLFMHRLPDTTPEVTAFIVAQGDNHEGGIT